MNCQTYIFATVRPWIKQSNYRYRHSVDHFKFLAMYESAGLKLDTDREIGEEAGRMRRQWTALTAAVGSSGEEAAQMRRQ